MSDKINRYIKLLNKTLSEEKLLEIQAQMDYNVSVTMSEVQENLSASTQKLHASIAQIDKVYALKHEHFDALRNKPSKAVEFAGSIFDFALNKCTENIAISLLDLQRLDLAATDFTERVCTANNLNNQRKIEAGMSVIKTVAWGAPILQANLDRISTSQALIESATKIFEDFCDVLVGVESDLLQILGKVHALKEREGMEFDAQLDRTYFILIDSLQTLAWLRNAVPQIEENASLAPSGSDLFDYASNVISQSIDVIRENVQRSHQAIEVVDSQVKFLMPMLEGNDQEFNERQKAMGCKVIGDTAANVSIICSSLNEVVMSQDHIHSAVQIFVEGMTTLRGIRLNLVELSNAA